MGELKKQLENIQDLVLVEDKIVTFKLVSKVLKVHTNHAKQLLFAFIQSPDFSKKVSATYLIGGEKSDKGLKYLLVKSDEIENAKKNFDTVLTEHVFSVQRNSNLSGTDLYNADVSYEINEEDRKFSSIKASDDIKIRNIPNFIPISKTVEASASKESIGKSAKIEPLKPVQEKESKTEEKKPSPVKEAPKKASPKKTNKKTVSAKGGGIDALFSRQASKPKETKQTEKECKENIEVKQDKIDIKEKAEPEVKKKKSENKKKRKKSKDGDSKKRKRIKITSDTESSSEEMEYQEEAPPTPEQEIPALADSDDEVIPPTPEVNSRKRVRKQIDQNFVDDEGFLHTKKEFVYESCSDDEAKASKPEENKTIEKPEETTEKPKEVKPIEKSPKAEKTNKNDKEKPKTNEKSPKEEKKKPGRPKAKAASPQKNKQRSITSFFQKK